MCMNQDAENAIINNYLLLNHQAYFTVQTNTYTPKKGFAT